MRLQALETQFKYFSTIKQTRRLEIVAVIVVELSYLMYYLTAGWLKVEHFVLGRRDTAIYQAALWQAGQFENPIVHTIPSHISSPFTGGHFMPIGFTYGLIYRFFPSMYTTVVIYALSFTLAGLFVYLLAQHLAQNGLIALGLSVTYLAVFTPGLDHFYFEDWATPYITIGLYFLVRKQYGWASMMFLLASMFKEYISLILVPMGLVMWLADIYPSLKQKQFRLWYTAQGFFGLIWGVGGMSWFLVAFWGIMPYFHSGWINMGIFNQLGENQASIVLSVLSKPWLIFLRMVEPSGREYLQGLFFPLALLPLLGLEYTGAIGFILLLNFLPDGGHAIHDGVNGHYTTMIQPILIAGTVLGIVRLRRWLSHRLYLIRVMIPAVLCVIIGFSTIQGIRYHGYKLREALVLAHTLALHTQDVESTLALIPSHASVAAEERLLPFLSHRQVIAHLDNIKTVQPEYIVRDAFYPAEDSEKIGQVIERSFRLEWKLYDYPPQSFYNPQVWESTKPLGYEYENYTPIHRQGSLVLLKRNL